jgi:hypothetical protein
LAILIVVISIPTIIWSFGGTRCSVMKKTLAQGTEGRFAYVSGMARALAALAGGNGFAVISGVLSALASKTA